jgi:GTP cyclohydrolase I
MNIHSRDIDKTPDRDEAAAALDVLKRWAKTASTTEIDGLEPAIARLLPGIAPSTYPTLSRDYPEDFAVDAAYKAGLPDLQNGPSSLIRGARQQIQHVGISNFRLPIRFQTRDNGDLTLETSVTGTVSLDADKKGINMSRIMRSFYGHADKTFSFGTIEAVKAVADLFSPLSGEVVEINEKLEDDPEIVNKDPYGDGWMVKIKVSDAAELDELMDAQAYEKHIGS